jgi:hypothetical protein
MFWKPRVRGACVRETTAAKLFGWEHARVRRLRLVGLSACFVGRGPVGLRRWVGRCSCEEVSRGNGSNAAEADA